jgi:beta-lactamase class D
MRYLTWFTVGAALALALALTLAPAAQAAEASSPGPLHCTILLDAASARTLLHEGRCGERVTPASTFKIAISLMGYDSGVLSGEHAPALPFREGYVDWRPSWRAPTDPARWMQESVVWYSQQVVARVGQPRFQAYVDRFGYGNRDLSDARHRAELKGSGLSLAWISSSLAISPDEQAAFLRKLVRRELGLKPRAYDMTAHILRQPDLPDGWAVWGKTGSGAPVLPNGKGDHAHAYGWFVGWASKGPRTVVFVRLDQDEKDTDGPSGYRARDALLSELPARLEARQARRASAPAPARCGRRTAPSRRWQSLPRRQPSVRQAY